MKIIALKIKDAIEEACQEQHFYNLQEICEAYGFTPKEFFDFISFGAQAYSDFLEQVEDHERGVY
jgi:hypothetical protein